MECKNSISLQSGRQYYGTRNGSDRVSPSALTARYRSRFCTPGTFWRAFGFLLLTFVLTGCRPGIHSATGGWPAASNPSPTAISSSAQVVKLSASPVSIPPNASADAVATLAISPGFHINANPATFPYLIATEVQHITHPDESLPLMGKPVYPAAFRKKFDFAEQPLAVYEGEVSIKVPLRLPNPTKTYGQITKGPHSFPITVKVQACDNEKCYPPATLEATIPIEVK